MRPPSCAGEGDRSRDGGHGGRGRLGDGDASRPQAGDSEDRRADETHHAEGETQKEAKRSCHYHRHDKHTR